MESSDKLVSIIMSEYNTNPDYLKSAIESILAQTHSNIEVILVDDGGANRLSELVEYFGDHRLKVIKNSVNKGFVYSLNRAISKAEGEYLARMDTDDIAMPDRIAKQLDFMEKNKQYAVVGGLAMEFFGGNNIGILGSAGEKGAKNIMRGDSMIHPSVMFRKADLIELGGYREYHRAEDLALWLEYILRGRRLFILDEVLLKYRVNPEDYKKRKIKNRKGELLVRLKYYPKLGAGPVEYARIARSILSGLLPADFVRWYRKKYVLDSNRRGDV